MKRIFNKSTQQQPGASYNQPLDEYGNIHPSLQSAPGSRSNSARQDELWRSSQPTAPPSPLKRSGGKGTGTPPRVAHSHSPEYLRQGAPSPPLMRSGKPSKAGGAGGAYPSYGEVQLDTNENRGGGQVNRPSNDPLEAVAHQKLPARLAGSRAPPANHSRSQSDARPQDLYQSQRGVAASSPGDPYALPNPYSSKSREGGIGRHNSMSRGPSELRNPLRGISRRASQSQARSYEQKEQVTRRASILAGADSGVHGGFASAAMASANEHDRQSAVRSEQERDPNVLQSEAKYVDRYVDVRTPQSVAMSTGMDKVKRRLFGRKKKDEGGDIEEDEKENSGEWARVEHPAFDDRQQDVFPVAIEQDRPVEPGNGHTHWFVGKKQNNKMKEETITSQIGHFCLTDEDEWNWDQLQTLCNAISHSELASKEAIRAFRKEFKSSEEQRFRSVRLWAIVCTRAGDRFRLQVASKKFLEALEDLYFDKKVTTKLRGRLLTVWSMLAYEFQQDQDLQPITKMFNKISPNEMAVNGVPLDPSHELFNPNSFSNGQQQQQQLEQYQQPHGNATPERFSPEAYRDQPAANLVSGGPLYRAQPQPQPQAQRFVPPPLAAPMELAITPPQQRSAVESPESDVQEQEQMQEVSGVAEDIRRLHEECSVARGNAQLMTDALIEHGLSNELVTEFAAKTQLSQDFIMAQIPWASTLAERSRAQRESWMTSGAGRESTGQQSSKEEQLLQDLLDTHVKLIAANSMITDARDRQREEDEERQAIEQSMREQRMDRSTLVEESGTGQLYSLHGNGLAPPMEERASGSRSPSPNPPTIRKPLPVPGSVERQNSLPLQPPRTNSFEDQITPLTSPSAYRGGPRPTNGKSADRATIEQQQQGENEADDSGSIIMTPIVPSAKALGKRRAVSIRESLPPSNSNNHNSTNINNTVSQVIEQVSNISIAPNEEALRARPPPALPYQPDQTPNLSTNPFYQ